MADTKQVLLFIMIEKTLIFHLISTEKKVVVAFRMLECSVLCC